MTPLTLKLAVPSIELIACILILRRISWRSHPALIAYLISEFVTRLLVLGNYHLVLTLALVRILVRTAVVLEVLEFARIRIPREIKGPAVGLALAVSAMLAGCNSGLRIAEETALFNQYYHLILCVALSSIAVRRWIVPMLECRRHRVYRVGMAAWLAVIAIAGCFVKGGIAYRVFPYSGHTWRVADLSIYVALLVIVGGMTVAMWLALPRTQVRALDRRRKRRVSVVSNVVAMRRAS